MTEQPTRTAPPPALAAAMQALRSGDPLTALEQAEAALADAGEPDPFIALAGLAALRAGEPARAIPHLRKLLAAHPADKATRANLAGALAETGDLDGALALAEGSDDVALRRIAGHIHRQRGSLEEAAAAYRQVVQSSPRDAASWHDLGCVLLDAHRDTEAVAALAEARKCAPRELPVLMNLAEALRRTDRGPARLAAMRDAAAIAPDERAVQTELALALAHTDDLEGAIAVLEKTVVQFPDFGESHIELGRLYETLNRLDDLARLTATIDPTTAPPEAAFLLAWKAQRDGQFDEAARLADGIPVSIHPMRRFHLVGQIADRRDDVTTAFAAFERMNSAAVADSPAPEGPTYRESIEADLDLWTKEWAENWKPVVPADEVRDPIFLVGFPRSGTTLLDTMLMGLPQLCVLEERPMIAETLKTIGTDDLPTMAADSVAGLRQAYFASARRHGWDGTRWLVDKHPLNMTRAPLIHRLFPRAKFILAERHPFDVVLSCYMANFQLNFAMRSFTTLDEAARTYDAAFASWERANQLFEMDVRRIRYERLVQDPRAELEPLVEWLGLEWDDVLLAHSETARTRGRVRTASYSQIGERLYTRASGRWRKYAANIAPVLPILKPWADRLGYETA